MPILDELKKQANGKADSANNIAEAIALMNFSEGGVTPEEIAESVSAYLDEHLTNPTNPPIDTSLSISGAAADAKETGDKITQLKEDLTQAVINGEMFSDVELTSDDFIQGYWDVDSVFSRSSYAIYSKRIAIKDAIQIKNGQTIKYDVTGFNISIKVFANPVGTSQQPLQATEWLGNTGIFTALYDGYLTINIRINNADDILPSDYDSEIFVPEKVKFVYSDAIAFVNDISDYIANSDIIDDGIKSRFVLHKAHSGSGSYIDYNTRNAIIHPIKLPFAIKVSISGSHDFGYQFYSSSENSAETLQQASGWITQCIIPANQWFCIAVRNSDNSTTDETTTESLSFIYGSDTFFVSEIENGRINAKGTVFNTIGDHIRSLEINDITDHVIGSGFAKTPIHLINIGTLSALQSFCIYDNKYYSTDGSYLYEQDDDFTVLSTTALSLGHGNSLQLGSNGVAYASGWNDDSVYVVDLESKTITNTITLPVTGYTICAIDDINGIIYIFHRTTYPDTVATYNLVAYDYVNDQIISTKKITRQFGGMQSCDFVDGKIFVLYGLGTNSVPNGYVIFDTNGNILSEYVIGSFSTSEPEGVFIDRDTFDVYISYVNKKLYKVTQGS